MTAFKSPGMTAATKKQPRSGVGPQTVTQTYTLTGALALNDTIDMFVLPANHSALDFILSTTDLDTDGAPTITLDVGDSGSAARYISASTVGQAGGVQRMVLHAAHGYTPTSDTTIVVKVSAAPATGAAAGTITLTMVYTPDL